MLLLTLPMLEKLLLAGSIVPEDGAQGFSHHGRREAARGQQTRQSSRIGPGRAELLSNRSLGQSRLGVFARHLAQLLFDDPRRYPLAEQVPP